MMAITRKIKKGEVVFIRGNHEPVFVERMHDGSLLISAFKHGHVVKEHYFGYSKRVALQKFKDVLR
jgi:hypothetical protein